MNRPAIEDLLGSILSTWYQSVAEWVPPGQLFATTCTDCRRSILAAVIDIAAWPHDLMHQLGTALDSAAVTIAESIESDTDPAIKKRYEAHVLACPRTFEDCVRDHVEGQIRAQAHDLLDVLEECVTPRLDEWIASQSLGLTPRLRG